MSDRDRAQPIRDKWSINGGSGVLGLRGAKFRQLFLPRRVTLWSVLRRASAYVVVGWFGMVGMLANWYQWEFRREDQRGRESTAQQVELQRRMVEERLVRMRADGALFGRRVAERLPHLVDDGVADHANERFGINRSHGYRLAQFFDQQGIERLRIDERGRAEQPREAKPSPVALLMKSAGGEIYLRPGRKSGHSELVYASAVRSPAGAELGTVMLHANIHHLFGAYLQVLDATAFGHMALLDRHGTTLVGGRFSEASPELELSQVFREGWERVRDRASGQFENTRGVVAFANIELGDVEGKHMLRVVSLLTPADKTKRLEPTSARLAFGGMLGGLFILVAALQLSVSQLEREVDEEQLAASEQRLRTLSFDLLSAQEEERSRLARELHDEVGQVGTAIHLYLQRAAANPSMEQKNKLMGFADEAIETLLQWSHDTAIRIRPTMLDDLGLAEALGNLTAEFRKASGLDVEVNVDLEGLELGLDLRQHAFRIVQEALTNVAKHSQARHVEVAVSADEDGLILIVSDDGVGFSAPEQDLDRLGVLGMRERTGLLGGRFMIDSEKGRGTTVAAVLPIDFSSPSHSQEPSPVV